MKTSSLRVWWDVQGVIYILCCFEEMKSSQPIFIVKQWLVWWDPCKKNVQLFSSKCCPNVQLPTVLQWEVVFYQDATCTYILKHILWKTGGTWLGKADICISQTPWILLLCTRAYFIQNLVHHLDRKNFKYKNVVKTVMTLFFNSKPKESFLKGKSCLKGGL